MLDRSETPLNFSDASAAIFAKLSRRHRVIRRVIPFPSRRGRRFTSRTVPRRATSRRGVGRHLADERGGIDHASHDGGSIIRPRRWNERDFVTGADDRTRISVVLIKSDEWPGGSE